MDPPKLGLVTCVHPYYELPAVTRHRDAALEGLREAGCEVVAPPIPRSAQEAVEIAEGLKRAGVDLALLFFCTWVAEEIPLALAREAGTLPLMLWALPYLDRDVPMPSPLSGLTASASNLRRLGRPFAHLIGPVDEERLRAVLRVGRVAAVICRLRCARFGLVGAACPGMLDVVCEDADLAGPLGATIVRLKLEELLEAARQASAEEAARLARELMTRVGAEEGVSEEIVAENLRLYLGMQRLVERHRLDGYAIRCWPELRNQLPVTACLTHVLTSEARLASACEADLPALVTVYLLSRLAEAPAFAFDVTAYLEDQGAIQLAHCGAADLALAAVPAQAVLRRHMRARTGATLEFPFKEGAVTLAKLLLPFEGRLRLFIARGEVIPAGAAVRGSVAHVRPEPSARGFLDGMIRAGVEHHLALVYGDWTRELSLLCELTGLGWLIPSRGTLATQ
jgi:L-fucose isomerase-like protein